MSKTLSYSDVFLHLERSLSHLCAEVPDAAQVTDIKLRKADIAAHAMEGDRLKCLYIL